MSVEKDGYSPAKLILAILIAALSLFFAGTSQARNIPGSSSTAAGDLSEAATASMMGGVYNGLLRARGDDRAPETSRGVSTPRFSFGHINPGLRNG